MKTFRFAFFYLAIFVVVIRHAVAQQNEFTFAVIYPPKLRLKPDTNTILLINQFDFTKQGFNGKQYKAFKAGALVSIKVASEQLATIPHTKVINIIDQSELTTNYYSTQVLAAKYHPDYILALSYYHVDVDQDEDDSHSFNKVLYIKFKLYVGEGELYKDIEGNSAVQMSRMFNIAPSSSGNKKFITEASKYAVYHALRDYIPYKDQITRPLYQDARLKPMVAEMVAGRYDKACELSEIILQDKDPSIASKAAYNLAVVYEIKHDLKGAIEKAQISLDKKANPYATDLLNELKTELKLSP